MEVAHWNPRGHKVQLWQRDGVNKQIVHIYELAYKGLTSDTGLEWKPFDFDFRKDAWHRMIHGAGAAYTQELIK